MQRATRVGSHCFHISTCLHITMSAPATFSQNGCTEIWLTDIALTFELDTDADAATVQRLVEMSERFCAIYQTLRAPPRLTVTHRAAAGA
jgi:uncharacterized OsmC-like protein